MKQLCSLALLAVLFAMPAFADVSITPGNVRPSADCEPRYGTAGSAINAGSAVYLDPGDTSTDYRVRLADADAVATADTIGIAVSTTTASGQGISYCSADEALTIGGTVTAGTIYYVSTTAGGIVDISGLATGDFPAIVGVGITGNKLYVKPFSARVAKP